jgi:NADPH2:quinone reductase
VAGPGQVVIDVAVAPTLFVETQIRRGWGREWFHATPPYVPGAGVAGCVRTVGNGVAADWVGQRVVADMPDGGGYAERAIAPVEGLIRVPAALGLPEAAALMHDGRTALALAGDAQIRADDRVLVLAAGGGLGILLVQLARAAGARVIAAAGDKQKLRLAHKLGADVSVDYSEPGWPERVKEATHGEGPNVVFDGAGAEIGRAAFEITARGGQFSAHGAPAGAFAAIDLVEAERRGVTVRGIEAARRPLAEARQLMQQALVEGAAGRLRPVIGLTLPLERAAEAHAAIEARAVVGKTLLVIR